MATTTAIILAELNSDYEKRQAIKHSSLDTSMEDSLLTSNAGDTLDTFDTYETYETTDTFETAKITNVTRDHGNKSVLLMDDDDFRESLDNSGISSSASRSGIPSCLPNSPRLEMTEQQQQQQQKQQHQQSNPLEKLQEMFQRTFTCACNINTINDEPAGIRDIKLKERGTSTRQQRLS